MEVTSENFEQALPLIEESIRNADFISFDAEFSGKCQKNACCAYISVTNLSRNLNQIYSQSKIIDIEIMDYPKRLTDCNVALTQAKNHIISVWTQ